jgi:hypothetical protein
MHGQSCRGTGEPGSHCPGKSPESPVEAEPVTPTTTAQRQGHSTAEAEHQPALAPVDSWLTARMFGGNFAVGPDWVVTTDDPGAAAVARRVLGGTGSRSPCSPCCR